jgi:hypothetical protein
MAFHQSVHSFAAFAAFLCNFLFLSVFGPLADVVRPLPEGRWGEVCLV